MRLSRLWKLLFAGSAIAAGASAAQAATWSGAYVGVNAGYAQGDSKADFRAESGFEDATDFKGDWDGVAIGAQAGYNFQSGGLVFGVEGDIEYHGRTHDAQADYTTGISPFTTNVHDQLDSEIEWFGTARARAGFAATDNLLLYGTGGFAFGDVKHAYTHNDTGYTTLNEFGSSSKTKSGWAVGGGAELALNDHWSAKAEYLHVDLGDSDVRVFDGSTLAATVNVKDTIDTVRVGLNYKF